jgi:DNA polymerase-1
MGEVSGRVAVATSDDRVALAVDGENVTLASLEGLGSGIADAGLICHGYSQLPADVPAAGIMPVTDTEIAAYLIEPGRAGYELDDLAAEYGVETSVEPATAQDTEGLVRAAATLWALAPLLEQRIQDMELEPLYREIELPLAPVLRAMEVAGVRIDTYRMGEITARLGDRVEELESKAHELAGSEFMLGSTQQVATVLFETLALTPGRRGKTGYSTDARVLRGLRGERRAPPHALQPDRCVDRATVDVESKSPVDSNQDGVGSHDPQRVRRRGRSSPCVGRLLTGRAADPRSRVG